MKRLLALLLLLGGFAHAAEVIPIDPVDNCFLCSSEPSLTMYWPGKDSSAVLILIPGGDGYVGLKPGQVDSRFHFFRSLKRLTDPALTRGRVDFVVLDSPRPLSPNQPYPAARGGADHLVRIESAIRYYATKTGLPVWLMGHSNGGISLTEFLKYIQKNGKTSLVSGLIASGVRNETKFEPPVSMPILFIHHASDACVNTMPAISQAHYEKVRAFNTGPTAFVTVNSGESESRDPCHSGLHMYFGAGDELSARIDEFMGAAAAGK